MSLPREFRFREDVGFERRCPACADWWPVTLEFWDKRWTNRCRACIRAWKRANQNGRYQTDAVYREARRQAACLTAWKDRQNRPDTIRARKAAYYRANAPRILETQRIRHAAKRTAA
jgi:hypothetical protein